MDKLTIAVDFDNTIAANKYPDIGNPVPGAFETMRDMQNQGYILILWTCRHGESLQKAVEYCKDRGVVFSGVNINPAGTTGSPKIVADYYIDDRAFGAELIHPDIGDPYIDWNFVRDIFLD